MLKCEKLNGVLEKNLELQGDRLNLKNQLEKLQKEKEKHIENNWNRLFDELFEYRKYVHITPYLATRLKYSFSEKVNTRYGFRLEESAKTISFVSLQKHIDGYHEEEYLFTVERDKPFKYFYNDEEEMKSHELFVDKTDDTDEGRKLKRNVEALRDILSVLDLHKSVINQAFYESVVNDNKYLENEIKDMQKELDDILDMLS